MRAVFGCSTRLYCCSYYFQENKCSFQFRFLKKIFCSVVGMYLVCGINLETDSIAGVKLGMVADDLWTSLMLGTAMTGANHPKNPTS